MLTKVKIKTNLRFKSDISKKGINLPIYLNGNQHLQDV